MSPIRAVTVYCSSSDTVPAVYLDAADELGRAIAANGWTLVYGGNRVGSMGRLADAARAADGKVVGITPQAHVDLCIGDDRLGKLFVQVSDTVCYVPLVLLFEHGFELGFI